MKKTLSVILILVLLITPAVGALTYNVVGVGDTRPIVVNGEAMVFDEVEPMSYNGRTLLPLRAVAEALGVEIDYVNGEVIINTIDIEELKKSCVKIYGENSTIWRQGSGVFIDYDEILTCYHVVDVDLTTFKIDDTYSASIGDISISKDAAILKVENTDIKPVKIGDSDTVKVGDKVYIISTHNGETDTVVSGEVLYFSNYYNIEGFTVSAKAIKGGSGGACFNTNGELIGIVQSGNETESDIVPINDIRKALAA